MRATLSSVQEIK